MIWLTGAKSNAGTRESLEMPLTGLREYRAEFQEGERWRTSIRGLFSNFARTASL